MRRTALVAFALLAACSAYAAKPDVEVKLRAAIEKAYPNVPKVAHIRPSPIAGLYEFVVAGEVKYIDAAGKYLIDGQMVDLATKANVTQMRAAEVGRIAWADLPHDMAFKSRVNGSGKRRILVFADPNCPACKMLEKSLGDVRDVTVYTVMLPILGADSLQKAAAIECAADPGKTWVNWMVDGVAPAAVQNCRPHDEKVVAFAKANGLYGTPAVFLADGTKLPGAIPASELNRLLDAR